MISGALPSLRRLPHDPATPKSLTHIATIQLLPLLAGEGGDGGEPSLQCYPLPSPPPRQLRAREGAVASSCFEHHFESHPYNTVAERETVNS